MYDSLCTWLCFLTAVDQRHTPIDNTDLSAQMRARGEDLEQAEAERTRVNQEVKKVEQNLKHLGDEVAKLVCGSFSLFSVFHLEEAGIYLLPLQFVCHKPRLHVLNQFKLKRFEAVCIAFTHTQLNRFMCKQEAVCKSI